MKRFFFAPLRTASALVGCGLMGLVFTSAGFGQDSASVSGRIVDRLGRPIPNAVVRLVSDTTVQPGAHPWRYTLMGDSSGKFSQEGIAPGAYLVMLFTDGKGMSVLQSVLLKAGDAPVIDFNMGLEPQAPVAGSGGALSMVARRNTSAPTR